MCGVGVEVEEDDSVGAFVVEPTRRRNDIARPPRFRRDERRGAASPLDCILAQHLVGAEAMPLASVQDDEHAPSQ